MSNRAKIKQMGRIGRLAAALVAAPVVAAEGPIPVKAPWQARVIKPYDWTGFYAGFHLGYAWGNSNWSAPPNLSSSLDLFQSFNAFKGVCSFFGGVQLGYDYMLANRFVIGIQADAPSRVGQILTEPRSAAPRSYSRRGTAWKPTARRCCIPALCAVALATLPAAGSFMRRAASPGPTTN